MLSDGEVAMVTAHESPGLKVLRLAGTRRRSSSSVITCDPENGLAIVTVSGAVVVEVSPSGGGVIVPARSVCLIGSAHEIQVLIGRGMQDHLIISYRKDDVAQLSNFLAGQSDSAFRQVTCGPGDFSARVLDNLQTALDVNGAGTPLAILGALMQFASEASFSPFRFCLNPLISKLPDALELLVTEVRSDPQKPWSLKDAAVTAGYSPFHLSRTFRAMVGYGFPEFVDRCRTERAVEKMLGNHELLIDEIGASCGFGSTQALRDAFREYLGLLPSEVRQHAGDAEMD